MVAGRMFADITFSPLTSTLVHFLAGIEVQDADEFDTLDLPPEMIELDPAQWSEIDVEKLKQDLWTMTIPGSSWGTRPAFKFPERPSPPLQAERP